MKYFSKTAKFKKAFFFCLFLLTSTLILFATVNISKVFSQTCASIADSSKAQVLDGFVTAPNLGSTLKLLQSVYSTCLIDSRTPFQGPSFDSLKADYYDKIKSGISVNKRPVLTGNYTQTAIPLNGVEKNQLYFIDGDLTLTGNVAGDKIGVIFVTGNLLIQPSSGNSFIYNTSSSKAGIVFVVRGNINIDQNTDLVDGVYVTAGTFCSRWVSASCPRGNSNQLVINGSVISLDSAQPPEFHREYGSNTEPAEKIIYQPKYLAILKDIFAKDISIWSEIQ